MGNSAWWLCCLEKTAPVAPSTSVQFWSAGNAQFTSAAYNFCSGTCTKRPLELPTCIRTARTCAILRPHETVADVFTQPRSGAGIATPPSPIGLSFQPVDATHWPNRCAGVSKFNVFRGRSFSCRATAFNLVCEGSDKSVPFGKYCLSKPLVFSFDPRCQGFCGSQKYTLMSVARVKR